MDTDDAGGSLHDHPGVIKGQGWRREDSFQDSEDQREDQWPGDWAQEEEEDNHHYDVQRAKVDADDAVVRAQRLEAADLRHGHRAPLLDLIRRTPGPQVEAVMEQYRRERMRLRQVHRQGAAGDFPAHDRQ